MNEWKKLEEDNIPPDILTGDYEFGFNLYRDKIIKTDDCLGPLTILLRVYNDVVVYFYRKNQSEPLTVKSGQTWVTEYKGIDYLYTFKNDSVLDFFNKNTKQIKNVCWKSFAEIELTDKIAKLRPIVIHKSTPETPDILYGVVDGMAILFSRYPVNVIDCDYAISNFKLATAKELQEMAE